MAEADATTTELEAIRAVVSTIEWTQRAELVDEFMDLFAANAIWTTSSGVRIIGREQIREFTERVLPGAMSTDAGGWPLARTQQSPRAVRTRTVQRNALLGFMSLGDFTIPRPLSADRRGSSPARLGPAPPRSRLTG
jgi:hypothetical protein